MLPELFSVDLRQDQRYLAEKDLSPMEGEASPGSRQISMFFSSLGPQRSHGRFDRSEKVVLADLLKFIKVHDPDVILFRYADTWVPLIVKKARRLGLEPTFG